MTLGRGHLMATVPLFVAAMAYNVRYFMATDDVAARPALAAPEAAQAPGPSVAGQPSAASDPASIPSAPEVRLDQLPAWTRNPFASPQRPGPALTDGTVVEAVQTQTEPDIVVGAILVTADRRRATVNGQNVTVGDRVGSATIVEIRPTAIVVESATEGRRTIAQQRRVPTAPPVPPRPAGGAR